MSERTLEWRDWLAQPLVAGLICSVLVLPARALGHETAQAFRRAVDHVVSRSDTLFAFVAQSDGNAELVRGAQAWGAWVIYGLVAGAIAMLVTRWIAGRALPWISVGVVCAIWLAVYAFVWNWNVELRFSLGDFAFDSGQLTFGPWPYAAFWGFFGGLVPALILAASPWRASAADTTS